MKKRHYSIVLAFVCLFLVLLLTFSLVKEAAFSSAIREEALEKGSLRFHSIFAQEREVWDYRIRHGRETARLFASILSGPASRLEVTLTTGNLSSRFLEEPGAGDGGFPLGVFLADKNGPTADLARVVGHADLLRQHQLTCKQSLASTFYISSDNWIAVWPGEWARDIEDGHNLLRDIVYATAAGENTKTGPIVTPIYYDDIWDRWLVALLFPIYLEGEFKGVVGSTVAADLWITSEPGRRLFEQGEVFIADVKMSPLMHRDLSSLINRQDFLSNQLFPATQMLKDESALSILSRLRENLFNGEILTVGGGDRVICVEQVPTLGWYYIFHSDLENFVVGVRKGIGRFLLYGVLLLLGINLLLFFFLRATVFKPIKDLIDNLSRFRISSGEKMVRPRWSHFGQVDELYTSVENVFTQLSTNIGEIEESKEYIETLMKTVQVFIVVLNRRLKPIYINNYALEKLGIKKDETSTMRVFDFVSKPFVKSLGYNFRDTNNILNQETQLRLKTGKRIHVDVSVSKLFNTTNDLIGYIAVVGDITKRKKAEMDLRNQISFSRQIFKAIPDMILIVDTDLKIVFYNEKAEKFLEELSSDDKKISHMLSQQSLEIGFDESLRNIIQNGEYIKQINVLNPLKEGFQYVDLIIEPIKTTSGIIGGLIIMRDISEWRSLTEKIKNLQEFMGKLIDASPFAIISINEYDSTTIWNKAAERLFKTASGRALNKNIFENHPFFLSYKDMINEVKALNKPIFLADQRMDFEGEPQSVLNLNLYPVQSEGRNVVVMVEDISEVRKLEDSLIQAQKMESLGLLTSGIIHDFNNVLSGIVGYASLLEQRITGDDEVKKYSSNIIASGERASGLIRQILDFSKKKLSRKEVLDINEVIEELLGFLKVNLRNIGIVKDLAQRSIRLSADKTKISQVVINLIINAKEALEETSDPEIRVKTEEVSIKGRETLMDGTYAQITISDNGPGINPNNIQKIFEPFFSTKDKRKSTGLGLAIVKDIIRDCLGDIDLQSQPDKGTTFTILIPSLKEELYEPPKPVEKPLESALEGAVLLIDDEAVIREIGRDMLDSMGLDCFTAANGEEGIQIYKTHKDVISLVLLDIEMPGLSGDRVADALTEINPDVKILFSSGYTKDYLESKVFKRKIENFIPKPFHLSQLSEKLNKLMREEN